MIRATPCAAACRRTRRPSRLSSPLLAILIVTGCLVPRTGHAQDPLAGYDPGLFELAAERLPSLVAPVLVDSSGSVLLPLEIVTRFLGFPLDRDGAQWRVPRLEGRRALLDAETRILRVGTDSVPLAPAELVRAEGELFLRAERVAELLEGEVTVDFARLVVTFTRAQPFPAQQRIELEQRRSVLLGGRARAPALPGLGESTATGAGIVDWEVATNGLDPTSLTTGRLQVGTAVLGGGLTAGARFEAGRDGEDRVRDTALRYHRAFAGGRWLAQVEAGDLITHGMFARFIRGAEITNAPWLRGYDLGEIALRPELPPGWQYEVIQGNQLLGYSEADARAPVSVPLRLGATPIEVRMYGPAGEEVVQRLVYQTPVTLLARNRVEYTLGGGTCPDDGCESFAHADLRWGALHALTVGTGAELFEDSAGSDFRPYALASFTTGTVLTGELQLMPRALYRANLVGYLGERTTARLHADVSRPGYGRLAAVSEAGHRYDIDAWLERRIGRAGGRMRQLRVNAGAFGRTEGALERWRLGAQTVSALGLEELRYDALTEGRDLVSAHVARYLGTTSRLRPTLLGTVGTSSIGIEILEAGAALQPFALAQLSGMVRWSRATGMALSIGWNSRLGPVQSNARIAAAEHADPTSTLALSGSAAFAPGRGVHGESLTRVGYGGVRGTAFLDVDGDGVLGAADTPLPDLPLFVAGAAATTDARGRYVAWGLLPYTDVPLVVDSLRIPDPSLALAREPMRARVVPNTAVRLDVPLVQTREVAGLVSGPDLPTVAGLRLLLTAEGRPPLEATTFSDGTFYVSRVRPGRYRLTVTESSLAALSAELPEPLAFEVTSGGDIVELPPLVVRRKD